MLYNTLPNGISSYITFTPNPETAPPANFFNARPVANKMLSTREATVSTSHNCTQAAGEMSEGLAGLSMNDEDGRDFKVEEDTWKCGVAVLGICASSSVAIDTLRVRNVSCFTGGS